MLAPHLQKTKKEYKNLKTADSRYIYQNKLNKACFQHEMAYGDLKYCILIKYCRSDKVLCDKAFDIAKNPKYDGYQRDFALMVCFKFLIKKLLLVLLKMKISQTKN